MSSFAVVLDACVLLPAALRDTLLRSAATGLYRPIWSEDILDELRRNLIENRGLVDDQAERLLAALRYSFPEACVRGYEPLTCRMNNDPKDRHVLAAAVKAGAQTIVTTNLRHFPAPTLSPFEIEALSPDDFLCDLYDLAPQEIEQILVEQAAGLRNPPMSIDSVIAEIAKTAPTFVAILRNE
jgi:predicted nucleic acid-binding protein